MKKGGTSDMENYRQIINGMRENMVQIRSEYQAELRGCPKGSLWKTDQNGRPVYFWAWRSGSEYVRISISKDPEMQQRLARKAFLIKSLKLLDRNIYQLDRALRGLEPLETGAVVSRLTKAYQDLPGEYFLYPSR